MIRTDKDSPRKFAVAVGNKFRDSEVLPLGLTEGELQAYRNRGFSILMVPMGYYENFLDDIDQALTDIAGISTSNASRYISGVRWAKCLKPGFENPMSKEVIQVGNGPEDTTEYYDFFDLAKVDPTMKQMPMFVHLDMSVSGDMTGVAGVWIVGKTPHKEGVPQSKELHYRLAFSFSVKAPKGYQVSYEKNRQFVYWLRDRGFYVRGVSTDSFQSVDTGQSLKANGFDYSVISMDIVGRDHVQQQYQNFRSTISEERIDTYETKQLTEEIIGLVRDGNGKIDHSVAGINEKDVADAVCGAVYNASQHAEEFAFDFGENLDAIDKTNSGPSGGGKAQMVKDFEEELKGAFDPFSEKNGGPPGKRGGGPAKIPEPQPIPGAAIMDGIII